MSARKEKTPKKKNVNSLWKNLDAIFQAQLRQCVLSKNEQKFNAITQELGFNEIQKGFLFDAIKTFDTHYMATLNPPKPLNLNMCNNNNNNINNNNNTNNKSNNKSPKKPKSPKKAKRSKHAIATNKNEKISGKKRRRSDITDISDSESSSDDNDNDEVFEDNHIFVVEKLVGHKQIGDNKYKYHVKWRDYDELSWEPHKNLMKSTINKYWKSIGYKCEKNGNIKPLASSTKKRKKKKRKKEKNGEAKEYKCVECDRTFKNAMALGGHNSAVHSKKKKQREAMLVSPSPPPPNDEDVPDVADVPENNLKNDDSDRDLLIVDSD